MSSYITTNINQYVDVMEKQAVGLLPEMGSAIRLCEIMKNLRIHESSFTLMDIGCATGHYFKSFRSRSLTLKYIGVDIDPNMIDAAKVWAQELEQVY